MTRLTRLTILCECPFYESCDLIGDEAYTKSRYEMYAEDSRAPSVAHHRDETDGAHPLESGPAIEVIELANGETVWYAPRHVSKILLIFTQ